MGKSKIILRHLIRNCPKRSKQKFQSYNILTYERKSEIIESLQQDNSSDNLRRLSLEYETSKKNILRWLKEGIQRKKGCGRKKFNIKAEDELEKWVLETCLRQRKKVSRTQIKLEALKIFSTPRFRASKAWQDSFIRERELKKKQVLLLYQINCLNNCQQKYFFCHLASYVKQEYDQVGVENFNFEDYIEYWNSATTNLEDDKFIKEQMWQQDSWNLFENRQCDSQFQVVDDYYL